MGYKWPEELNFMVNSRKPQKTTTERLDGKVVVISGATSGVGYQASLALAEAGATIILVARNLDKAKKVGEELNEKFNTTVQSFYADFSDLDTVKACVEKINKEVDKIDILINSVGIHSTKKTFTKHNIEKVFVVNHLSIFLFTNLLLEKMKQSAPSRIIQVSSEGHRFGGVHLKKYNFNRRLYTGLRSYGQAKTAQLLTNIVMNEKLQGTGVTLNAMHPGAVKTNIGSNNGILYRLFLRHVTWHFLKDPKISGDALYYLAASKEMENVSGKFFNLTIDEVPAKHARNKEKAKLVYDLSCKLVGINEDDRM